MTSAKKVAEIWSLLVADEDSGDAERAIEERASQLCNYPEDVLAIAGFAALEQGGGRRRLALSKWAEASASISRGRTARPDRLRGVFEDPDIAIALTVRDEVSRAQRALGMPYRRRIPLGWVPGLNLIDEDELETRAALAIALTAPDGQFSVDGDGAVFAGHLRGFHQDGDRVYVDGLSRALDDVGAIVYQHRHGMQPSRGGRNYGGGRFYIQRNSEVICAACGFVVTKVGARPHQQEVVGCTA